MLDAFSHELTDSPLSRLDSEIAHWFEAHSGAAWLRTMHILSGPGSAAWIGFALVICLLVLAHRNHWRGAGRLILSVPVGMFLSEGIKLLVHRARPISEGPGVDWAGYSFPSGHTIGATLLYGMFILALAPAIKSRARRWAATGAAVLVIALVGFSRIALRAHYLTDVFAGIFFGSAWLVICSIACRARVRRERVSAISDDDPTDDNSANAIAEPAFAGALETP